MPVFEFACRECQKTFEVIRPMPESASTGVTCIYCGSTTVERISIAVYAVASKREPRMSTRSGS